MPPRLLPTPLTCASQPTAAPMVADHIAIPPCSLMLQSRSGLPLAPPASLRISSIDGPLPAAPNSVVTSRYEHDDDRRPPPSSSNEEADPLTTMRPAAVGSANAVHARFAASERNLQAPAAGVFSAARPLPASPMPNPPLNSMQPGVEGSTNAVYDIFGIPRSTMQAPAAGVFSTSHPLSASATPVSSAYLAFQTSSFSPSSTLIESQVQGHGETELVETSARDETPPPPHARPLYATIPLPPVEDTEEFGDFGLRIEDEGLVDRGLASLGLVVPEPINPNLRHHSASGTDTERESFASSAPYNTEWRTETAQPPFDRLPSSPNLEDRPGLNAAQLYAALLHASPSSASSPSASSLYIDCAALLNEPATTPGVGHLTLMVRSSGQIVQVTASRGVVTVGNVRDALAEAFAGYFRGCEACVGVCSCVRMEAILDAVEMLDEEMRG